MARKRGPDLERLARRAVGGDIEAAERLLEEVSRRVGTERKKPDVWLVWRQTFDEGHETLSAWSTKESALREIGRRVEKEIDEYLAEFSEPGAREELLRTRLGERLRGMLGHIDAEDWPRLTEDWNEFVEDAYREKAQVKYWVDGGYVLDTPGAMPHGGPACVACGEESDDLEPDEHGQLVCESCTALRDKTMEEMD